MSELVKNLIADFADDEYAHAYMESHTVSRIAAQIHALRKQRNWSQAELAERAGVSQERVSKLESADFSSVTLKTLHKFSEAFDVHLHVAFNSFSQGILDIANLSPKALEVVSREEDLAHMEDSRVVETNGEWRLAKNGTIVVLQPPVRSAPVTPSVSPQIDSQWHQFPVIKTATTGR